MARPKSSSSVDDRGLFPESLNLTQAYEFLVKQQDDLIYANNRIEQMKVRLGLMIESAGSAEVASSMDGFTVTPVYRHICTGITLTLKL